VREIEQAVANGAGGAVVTQGTDTLEESAVLT
jgi:L-asparaginase/Glu-tRNA(Gln) amidotransferase subunit D